MGDEFGAVWDGVCLGVGEMPEGMGGADEGEVVELDEGKVRDGAGGAHVDAAQGCFPCPGIVMAAVSEGTDVVVELGANRGKLGVVLAEVAADLAEGEFAFGAHRAMNCLGFRICSPFQR